MRRIIDKNEAVLRGHFIYGSSYMVEDNISWLSLLLSGLHTQILVLAVTNTCQLNGVCIGLQPDDVRQQ